jgi:PKD repeat protein
LNRFVHRLLPAPPSETEDDQSLAPQEAGVIGLPTTENALSMAGLSSDLPTSGGMYISPKKKLAIVATTTVIALILVVVGLASLAPKSKPESVNRPPVALFVYDANNLTVMFNASASNDPDGTIANYSWSFGDGTEGSGVDTAHTYLENGTYKVILTVTDNGNKSNSTSEMVTISLTTPPAKQTPKAVIQVVSKDNLTVTVSGEDSLAPEGASIIYYNWTFGDGEIGMGTAVNHTYSANGTYTISLTVTADNGEMNSTSVDVTVSASPPSPPPPPQKNGPPGLLHAIEIHEQKADRNRGLQHSLATLKANLNRWLYHHGYLVA